MMRQCANDEAALWAGPASAGLQRGFDTIAENKRRLGLAAEEGRELVCVAGTRRSRLLGTEHGAILRAE
jgi:hypothetical protein